MSEVSEIAADGAAKAVEQAEAEQQRDGEIASAAITADLAAQAAEESQETAQASAEISSEAAGMSAVAAETAMASAEIAEDANAKADVAVVEASDTRSEIAVLREEMNAHFSRMSEMMKPAQRQEQVETVTVDDKANNKPSGGSNSGDSGTGTSGGNSGTGRRRKHRFG